MYFHIFAKKACLLSCKFESRILYLHSSHLGITIKATILEPLNLENGLNGRYPLGKMSRVSVYGDAFAICDLMFTQS